MSLRRRGGRLPVRIALAVLAVASAQGALTGCGGGEASLSSDQVRRDARVVLRADLAPGSTGETAARIVRRFSRLDGVWGTRGDSGRHVWVYSTGDAPQSQVAKIRARLGGLTTVVSVTRLR